jgi:hypothetical protein
MPTVTLRFRADGSLQISPPPPVTINRLDQKITWNLVNGSWLPDGIFFDKNPPPGADYQAWPGAQASLVDGNYFADGNDPLPPGSTEQVYHYTINAQGPGGQKVTMIVGEDNPDISVDPIVDNQPEP